MTIRNHVLNSIKKHDLFSSNERIVVGVSGGPDSLALLYVLHELQITLGIRLIVAHLHHNLRGREADLDERFVRRTALHLQLPYIAEKIKWKRKNLAVSEESLRKHRHNFLFKVAKHFKAEKIALGHTLDDQAETVLMRIIRGTGLYGLVSMLPKRSMGRYLVVRPLLEVSRSQINTYLKYLGLKPRIDSSNLKSDFTRNRVRNKVLKEICSINPKAQENMARFAQTASLDYDYLYKQAESKLDDARNKKIRISLKGFSRYHLALQRMVMRVALERLSGSLSTFNFKHWEEIHDLIRNRPVGSIVNLTKGVSIEKDKKSLLIRRS